jgi:TonB family protein
VDVAAQATRPVALENAGEIREMMFEEYTLEMRQHGLVGRPLLEMMIGVEGRASELRVVERSGNETLDALARKIARRMKFDPARLNGEKVSQQVRLPLVFESTCGIAPAIVEDPDPADLLNGLNARAISEHPQPKRVLLDVLADVEGRPVSASVLVSSGLAEADSLAIRQVLARRYEPVEWKGKPIPASYRSTVLPGRTALPPPETECSGDFEYPVLKNRSMLHRSMQMIGRGMDDSGRTIPRDAAAILWVRPDGRVGQALIYESSCWEELDSYLKSIWIAGVFEPARCDGEPYGMYVSVPVSLRFPGR